MRILHLLYESEGDTFGIGGVGIRAYEIYKYLCNKHDITLLCKKYPGARNKRINGLKHIFVGTESNSLTITLLFYAFHAARFVRKYGHKYDIIIEDFSPAIPTFLHNYKKKPLILQIQGYTGIHYFRKYNPLYSLILYTMEKFRPRFYNNFIFINKETIRNLFGNSYYRQSCDNDFSSIHEKFFGIISNGISAELLETTPNERDYILYIGRIDIYGKGLDLLLKAYREFSKYFPNVKLIISGDGRDSFKFRKMLKDLPLHIRNNVEITGWVSGRKKISVLQNALFCVFPSRHEVQGISVLEAMACRKPVIVSDLDEFKYIHSRNAGITFKSGDFQSLLSAMITMMNSNTKREMGSNGRVLAHKYIWKEMAFNFEKFLLDVIKRHEKRAISGSLKR